MKFENGHLDIIERNKTPDAILKATKLGAEAVKKLIIPPQETRTMGIKRTIGGFVTIK